MTLAAATALLGAGLVVVGRLKGATLVQFLPEPVVGGYLAFIGLFCGEAGVALMTGLEISGPGSWHLLAEDPRAGRLMAPGLVLGAALYALQSKAVARRLPARARTLALPAALLLILVGFYAALALGGVSLAQARADGWLDPPLGADAPAWYEVWKPYGTALAPPTAAARKVAVHNAWFGPASALSAQIGTWIGMFFVVAFGSSLDVAAVQMEVKERQLDYNHELRTVGLSNLFSGLTGGFTGSYIFSQTIFSVKAGVTTRANAVVVILAEVVLFLLPISILAYVPKLFFGAILCYVAVELVVDWLVMSWVHGLVSTTEFVVVWATFVAINAVGLEAGMAIGICVARPHHAFPPRKRAVCEVRAHKSVSPLCVYVCIYWSYVRPRPPSTSPSRTAARAPRPCAWSSARA